MAAQDKAGQDEKVTLCRIHRIDDAIRSGRFPNAESLSKELEVSVRTINRDFDMLRDMYDAPLKYDPVHRGFCYTEPNFFIKYVPLRQGELFSLALFDTLLLQYRNTPLEGQLKKIFRKIESALPDTVSVDSRFLSEDVTYIPDALASIDTDVFDKVLDALRQKRTIRFDYEPLQKTTYMQRELDPYHVVCQRGNWYAIGYCHYKKEVRLFSFSRMKNPELLRDRFTVPEKFSASDYIDDRMGVWASARIPYRVRLLFAPEIGTFAAERTWHDGQKIVQHEDGSVEVSFTTTQLPEVQRRVLGQGHTVRVLEPPELIEAVKKEAAEISGMY